MSTSVLGRAAGGDFEPPELTTSTAIGITVAIAGNMLISLALNLQKLAHRRVETARANAKLARNTQTRKGPVTSRAIQDIEGSESEYLISRNVWAEDDAWQRRGFEENDDAFGGRLPRPSPNANGRLPEAQHLLPSDSHSVGSYGAGPSHNSIGRKHKFASRLIPPRIRSKLAAVFKTDGFDGGRSPPPLVVSQEPVSNGGPRHRKVSIEESDEISVGEDCESDYLKSKLWWFGFLLMNLGEVGNFISYAFAPASIVAPLGTFALMANCFFAPILLGERFRKVDLLGIFIAIIGAVTVVLSSNTSDVRLDPDGLMHAISQRAFVIFSCVYVVGAVVLAILSETRASQKWVFVDVGLCALFGGFTVLSTKAVSTLLTLEWFEMFTNWITYPVIVVLVLTGVGQVRYLNRALMRFDSKVVIPIQFVLFTLSAIIGSAVLYGDFKKATFHQLVTFFYGCIATFLGVFIIAWVPTSEEEAEEEEAATEGTETPRTGTSAGVPRSATDDRVRFGSLSGRPRTMLHPGARDTPSVRRRQSLVGIGVSPAQHLLLVHTPPRDIPERRYRDSDAERDSVTNVDPINLRRVRGRFDDDARSIPRQDDSI